jgi:hypothetical protein
MLPLESASMGFIFARVAQREPYEHGLTSASAGAVSALRWPFGSQGIAWHWTAQPVGRNHGTGGAVLGGRVRYRLAFPSGCSPTTCAVILLRS